MGEASICQPKSSKVQRNKRSQTFGRFGVNDVAGPEWLFGGIRSGVVRPRSDYPTLVVFMNQIRRGLAKLVI